MITQTQEWQDIIKNLEKRKEKIIKHILTKNPENNVQKYSERDLLITQIEMIDIFIKSPDKLQNYFKENE